MLHTLNVIQVVLKSVTSGSSSYTELGPSTLNLSHLERFNLVIISFGQSQNQVLHPVEFHLMD